MSPYQFERDEFESFLDNHELDFEHRRSRPVPIAGDDREEWMYSAPLEDGFIIVLQLAVVPDSKDPEFHRDEEMLVNIAHESYPDEFLTEVVSMPLVEDWRQYFQTQVDKAYERIQDLEHCEECDLPMLKFHDYVGPFYACVSFDCDNIIEVETIDQTPSQGR